MSCRHDLANGACAVCYPDTGAVFPTSCDPNLDGPGAAPANPDEADALTFCHPFHGQPSSLVKLVRKAVMGTNDPKRTERARLLDILIRCRKMEEARDEAAVVGAPVEPKPEPKVETPSEEPKPEPEKTAFKSGAAVRLKVGGPRMVVDAWVGSRVVCNWFAEGRLVVQSFSPETLVPIEGPVVPVGEPAAFKVGDRVQVLLAPYAGQVGTVMEQGPGGALIQLDGSQFWFLNKNLAHALSFAVGDRVVFAEARSPWQRAVVGVVLVSCGQGGEVQVKFDGVEEAPRTLWCNPRELALAPAPAEGPTAKKIEVGDRIRVTGGTYQGCVGVLVEAPSGDSTLAGVHLDNRVDTFKVYLTDLAPEEREPFKIGELVVVRDDGCWKGRVGTVVRLRPLYRTGVKFEDDARVIWFKNEDLARAPKFKTGDRVLCEDREEVGTVRGFDGEFVVVRFPVLGGATKKLDPRTLRPAGRYHPKKGDRVTVHQGPLRGSRGIVAGVLAVVKIDDDEAKGDVNGGSDTIGLSPGCLRLTQGS